MLKMSNVNEKMNYVKMNRMNNVKKGGSNMKGDKILLPILVKFVLNTLKQIRRCPLFSLDLSASTFLWKTQPSTYLATFRRPHSPF